MASNVSRSVAIAIAGRKLKRIEAVGPDEPHALTRLARKTPRPVFANIRSKAAVAKVAVSIQTSARVECALSSAPAEPA
jgi:hypothetical protein